MRAGSVRRFPGLQRRSTKHALIARGCLLLLSLRFVACVCFWRLKLLGIDPSPSDWQVLRGVTMPNVILNQGLSAISDVSGLTTAAADTCNAATVGLATTASPTVHAAVVHASTVTGVVAEGVHTRGTSPPSYTSRFFAGDWSAVGRLLREAEVPPYDVILTAETVYSPDAMRSLFDLCAEMLRVPSAEGGDSGGVLYVAAKTYYFGVGGGLRDFERLVHRDGRFDTAVVCKFEGGVSREILEVSWRSMANVAKGIAAKDNKQEASADRTNLTAE